MKIRKNIYFISAMVVLALSVCGCGKDRYNNSAFQIITLNDYCTASVEATDGNIKDVYKEEKQKYVNYRNDILAIYRGVLNIEKGRSESYSKERFDDIYASIQQALSSAGFPDHSKYGFAEKTEFLFAFQINGIDLSKKGYPNYTMAYIGVKRANGKVVVEKDVKFIEL